MVSAAPPYDGKVPRSTTDVRLPLQRRSQEAFDRVLRAGREILETDGVEGFTVQAVSRRAEVSVGSIYQRVSGREALLLAIQDRALAEMEREEDWVLDIGDAGTPRQAIMALVDATMRMMLRNARILRAFMRRGPQDPEIWKRGQASSQKLAIHFERALLSHRSSIRHPDPELAADFVFRMVYSTTSRWITHGPNFESARVMSEDEFVREMSTAAADYLVDRA
jgi:AcrR family transcriptional regulator